MEQASTQPWYRRLSFDSHTARLMIIIVIIFVAFSLLLPGKFFTVRNMQSMAVQFPEFGILAFAMLITMLTGGIDLSVVGIANLAALTAATILTGLGGEGGMSASIVIPLAMLAALAVGSVCGIFNGLLVARIGITPILATLGTGSLYTGLGYVVTGGPAITTTQFAFLGNGSLLGVPIPVIIFIVLTIFFAILLNRTTFGFNVYMLGTNPVAARFSGINIDRVILRTYWLAGVVGGIAGIIFLARANSAKPDYGSSFILLTVLIAILGGVSYTGGFGTVTGLVLAILSIQFLSTGLNMLMLELSGSSAAIFFRQFAWGALLLLVMVINYYIEERKKRRISRQ
ncbi:MAG: ABC transporter permease [Caldilineaceae bacterium]|nr:ABC transporter permease [Caldilineaceae bacterium]MCB9137428.1 ABC transporter permease [Caldilineaceae bacterium]